MLQDDAEFEVGSVKVVITSYSIHYTKLYDDAEEETQHGDPGSHLALAHPVDDAAATTAGKHDAKTEDVAPDDIS